MNNLNKFKLSPKEGKLLFILISLMILGGSYQFVYLKNIDKLEVINGELDSLNERLSILSSKEEKRETMLAETKVMNDEIEQLVDTYGNGSTIEKNILFIKELEGNANMSVDTISVSEDEYFLTKSVESDNTYQYGSSSVNKGYVLNEDNKYLDYATLSGYKTNVSISFKVNYENLKRCIDYINSYEDKRNISEISLAYDSETGNLKGFMNIQMFHLLGTKEPYMDPNVAGDGLGTDNIFGTIELP